MFWVHGEARREYMKGVAPGLAWAHIFTHPFNKQPTEQLVARSSYRLFASYLVLYAWSAVVTGKGDLGRFQASAAVSSTSTQDASPLSPPPKRSINVMMIGA
jgi:hypothetical protein